MQRKRNIPQKLCLTLILTFATFLFITLIFVVVIFHFRLTSLHNTYCILHIFHTSLLLYFLLYEHYLDFQFSIFIVFADDPDHGLHSLSYICCCLRPQLQLDLNIVFVFCPLVFSLVITSRLTLHSW